jgi:hypothetical protein
MKRPVVWRKSSYSGPSGCVQIAFVNGLVAVRHSKQKQGPTLTFTPTEWRTFLRGVEDGEFNLPAELVDGLEEQS